MKYQRNNSEYRFTPVDGEMVMLHKPSGNLIGMNTVASAIWIKIKDPMPFNKLIDFLIENFEIDRATCENHTKIVLDKMIQDKMVSIKE